jgi:hypothetical protein
VSVANEGVARQVFPKPFRFSARVEERRVKASACATWFAGKMRTPTLRLCRLAEEREPTTLLSKKRHTGLLGEMIRNQASALCVKFCSE